MVQSPLFVASSPLPPLLPHTRRPDANRDSMWDNPDHQPRRRNTAGRGPGLGHGPETDRDATTGSGADVSPSRGGALRPRRLLDTTQQVGAGALLSSSSNNNNNNGDYPHSSIAPPQWLCPERRVRHRRRNTSPLPFRRKLRRLRERLWIQWQSQTDRWPWVMWAWRGALALLWLALVRQLHGATLRSVLPSSYSGSFLIVLPRSSSPSSPSVSSLKLLEEYGYAADGTLSKGDDAVDGEDDVSSSVVSKRNHHHRRHGSSPHGRRPRPPSPGSVPLPTRDFYGPAGPDFGGLQFDSLRFYGRYYYRVIDKYAGAWYEEDRSELLSEMDRHHVDDSLDHWEEMDHSEDVQECHRLKWVDSHRPTCNHFHEIHLGRETSSDHVDLTQPYQRRYLAHGYYRDSWLLEPVAAVSGPRAVGGAAAHTRGKHPKSHHHHHHISHDNEDGPPHLNLVLKALRYTNPDLDYSWSTAHHMYKEALVMERTTSSNRTMDIYGHCYTSLLVEHGFEISQRIVQGVEYHGRGRIAQHDLDALQAAADANQTRDSNLHALVSFNDFSAIEKLDIALAMAEGLAVMHGHPEGVIVNDDVHPDQYLVNKDGLVKFNDMNNAHILEWNPSQNDYCKWHIWIGGDYRSPEEMRGEPIDEKSDVWPMGALMFGLLTGLFPYYTIWERSEVEKVIASGEPPYLDPRWKTNSSFVEGRMVEVMERCWANISADRPSIFEVVRHLRETQLRAHELERLGMVDWSTEPAGLVPKVSVPSPDYEKFYKDDGGDDGGGDDGGAGSGVHGRESKSDAQDADSKLDGSTDDGDHASHDDHPGEEQ